MRIVHFSDPHAGGPAEDWMAYLDKRWVGVFNYNFRRRFQHDLSLLSKGIEYILATSPDLVVCTGDITSTGQPGEFKAVMEILEPLRNSSIPMIYVPGNHDCYVHYPKCVRAMQDAFKHLNTAFNLEFNELPVVKEFKGLEFIIINESQPTSLLSSCGYLDQLTNDFIQKLCIEKPKNKPRIIIGHYPLIEEHPISRLRHRLWGQREILQLLNRHQIDVSLCGHMHIPCAKINSSGRGEIIAGSITRNHCMAVIDYVHADNTFNYEKINVTISK